MSNPQIIVCTPTFHRPSELKRAMDSVLAQSYAHWLHVIVKDGCDRVPTCAICAETDALGAEYMRKDARFRYVSLTEHKGGYGFFSRNHAIETTNAPLIAYLDDDCWWESNHLETLAAALERHKATFAFSGSNVFTANGRLILKRITRKPYFSGIDTNELLHRRELVEKYGGWKPHSEVLHNHDWELICRWMQGHEPYAATGQATSNYTLNHPVLLFWYSYLKHRVRRAVTSVVMSDARYYRPTTLSPKTPKIPF
jgi:glycosyltransferase involved in cell wall biosynthesis